MENVTEELVRQNGNQAAAVMADYAGQGGSGSTSGATISSVVTPQEATEEQRGAVLAALTAAGVSHVEATGLFIPAASIDDMPLAIAFVDEGAAGVLFLKYYSREDGMVGYSDTSGEITVNFIAIDGGFGSWKSKNA